MARNPKTRARFENISIVPNSAHGDSDGDIALAIYPIDSDDISTTTTPSFFITENGEMYSATGTLGTISVSAEGGETAPSGGTGDFTVNGTLYVDLAGVHVAELNDGGAQLRFVGGNSDGDIVPYESGADDDGRDLRINGGVAGTAATTGRTGGTIFLTGGAGSTGSTGTDDGGTGGAISLVGGGGGGGKAGTATSGAGGAVTVSGAAGCAATENTGTGGAGGAGTFQSGAGGIGKTTGSGGAGGDLAVTGGAGGASGAGGTGGAGSVVAITAGDGGLATTTGTGGAGGTIGITAGAGGQTATGTAGAAGTVTLTAGAGGACTGDGTPAVGGAVAINAGAGGAEVGGTGAVGGAIILTAGTGGASTTGGAGGDVNIYTGVAGAGGAPSAGTFRIKTGGASGTEVFSISGAGVIGIAGTLTLTQTSSSGNTLKVQRDLASANTDSAVMYILQDNTGDDQAALSIKQDGDGNVLTGAYGTNTVFTVGGAATAAGNTTIAQFGTAGNALKVSRDLASANTDSPLVYLLNDNAGDDQVLLSLKQDGSGAIIDATVFSVSSTGNIVGLSTDIGGGYSGGSGLTVASTGALTGNSTAQFDGVITSGITGSNGGLVIKETSAGATKFSIAGATGIVTLAGGATVDNNTDTGILNLTETTVRATGAFDVTGNSTLASVDIGGGYASSGLTVAADGALTGASTALFDGVITSGKTGSNGGLLIKSTGAGATTFGVAGATGIVTFAGGATADNNTDTGILNLTETLVKVTGNFESTGSVTSASESIGGGYVAGTGGSGASISAAGAGQFNGALNTDSTLTSGVNGATGIVGGLTINNGANPGAVSFAVAGATGIITMDGGATLDNNADANVLNITETTVRVTGAFDVTGNSTLASADIGGGYIAGTGGSGATLGTTGTGQFNGAVNTDSTLTSGVNGATGIVGGLTINNGANPGAASFAVAGATGIVTLAGGGTIDNNTDTGILNLTETLVKVTGNAAITGSLTIDDVTFTPAGMVQNYRERVTVSALNTGAVEILPAVTGKKYRIVDLKLIAYGGNLGATAAATGVKLTGTQSAAGVALVSIDNAALTQSTAVSLNSANVTVLADGAGLMVCDANTAINMDVITAGARDLITATGIDVIVDYVVEE